MKNTRIIGVVFTVYLILVSCNTVSKKDESAKNAENKVYDRTHDVPVPDFAIQLLKEGNERFVRDVVQTDNLGVEKRKALKEKGQKPFAIILTCSDSRVPPEIIFDQGLGDLFVIRVAGNVIDSIVMGSIEYGAEHLHSSLLLVLGHEKCGAVTASVEGGEVPGSIPSICERIKPVIKNVKKTTDNKETIVDKVIEGNVKANVTLLENDKLLNDLIESGKLKVLGGIYHLESGEVTFL